MILSLRSFLLALVVLVTSTASFAQVGISVSFGPPALPVYEQPLCPGDGYLWTPGYWAWDDDGGDYYWVPGTWILAPQVGFLWTPPYWAWNEGAFVFYDGYWGPHVGFYGGVVYGFGYFGSGFVGGRWDGDHYFYNRTVANVNVVNVRNVYNETVVNNNVTVNRVSYNGGPGGVQARPRPEDETAAHERHIPPVAVQAQHTQTARSNPELRASANQGKPPIAATAKPADFKTGAVSSKQAGGAYKPPPSNAARGNGARSGNNAQPDTETRPENTTKAQPNTNHAGDLKPHQSPPPNTGNADADKKYQQQQEKLAAQQTKDHQKLQQQQEKEHQQGAQKNYNEAQKQQMEQRHAQQTQQVEQKHATQQQQMEQHQAPHQPAPKPQGPPPSEKPH
jgi:hypothetical protein